MRLPEHPESVVIPIAVEADPEPGWRKPSGSRRERREASDPALPRFEDRLADIDQKISDLEVLAEKEPATAETRKWHINILQKQRELFQECGKRDQSVSAQLQAFPDAFDVILGRVTASEFSAAEVETYMGGIVQEVENTARFVEAMRPAMDEMLGTLTVAG